MVPYDYLKQRQPEVCEKLRAVLVEWLIEVHAKFKMLPETLYLSVNIIDRFLAIQRVARRELQAVGLAAILIASKYEEIYPPRVTEFVRIAERKISRDELLAMEFRVLSKLDFDLTHPSSFLFLERYIKLARADDDLLGLAQCLCEHTLLDYKFLRHRPSRIAAASLSLAF